MKMANDVIGEEHSIYKGPTPLKVAQEQNKPAIVRLLKEAGAIEQR